jgi:hypothetical protein
MPDLTSPVRLPGSPLPGPPNPFMGMRERAAVFGGEVSAGPRSGGGWRVHTVLRLRPDPPGSGQGTGKEVM